MLRTFAYVRPASVSEALKQLEDRGARIHAGGTDLLGCLRDGVFERGNGRQPRAARRTARHHRGARRRTAPRRARHDRRDRRAPGDRREVRGARPGGLRGGQPAAPQPGHHRRQPVPAAAVLVLPRRLRTARGRAATRATPSAARTSTTASSAAAPASSCTRRTRRRRSSPSTPRCGSPVRRAPASSRSSSSSCCPRRTRRGRPCSSRARWCSEVLVPAASGRADERVPEGARARVVGLRHGRPGARRDDEGRQGRRRARRALGRRADAVAAPGRREAAHRAEARCRR